MWLRSSYSMFHLTYVQTNTISYSYVLDSQFKFLNYFNDIIIIVIPGQYFQSWYLQFLYVSVGTLTLLLRREKTKYQERVLKNRLPKKIIHFSTHKEELLDFKHYSTFYLLPDWTVYRNTVVTHRWKDNNCLNYLKRCTWRVLCWRAQPGFEPGTSRTRSANHTPRPTSRHLLMRSKYSNSPRVHWIAITESSVFES